jgi:thiol-disulfide isomerase/thioredoxin
MSGPLNAAENSGTDVRNKLPLLQATDLLQAPPGTKLDAGSIRGNVVILEFWATWCGPCVVAIPHLNELAEEFKGKPKTRAWQM